MNKSKYVKTWRGNVKKLWDLYEASSKSNKPVTLLPAGDGVRSDFIIYTHDLHGREISMKFKQVVRKVKR